MKKTTFFTIAIVALLALNTVTLAMVFLSRPPEGAHHRQPKEVIIERLHFDSGQVAIYEKHIAWHRGQIQNLDNQIRHAKGLLYQLLADDTHIKTKESLIAKINSLQKQVEETHFKHFEDIRAICRPDQLQYFTDLASDLPMLFGPKPPGPGHP